MKITTRKGKSFLQLDGEINISRAAELKDALLESLEKAESVEVNLDNITGIDLSCLQLLCSAHRTASKEGKKITIKDPTLPLYVESRKNAGFMYSKPCRHVTTDDCLWVGGKK